MPDVDLELPKDGTVLTGEEGVSLPESLESDFDVEDVLRRWREYAPVSSHALLFLSTCMGGWGWGMCKL
jgi:hypothetical protein